ncbi:MAG: hypothetical protein DMG57_38115 [Acidobacteria bacterium]|nr:MAG: hypothetical protein DMG57_38115 [Acidobacteriota bacterium]
MPGDWWPQVLSPLISTVSGLGGVTLGGWITYRSQRKERKQRFVREQLSEFYAPMLGYRNRIRAKNQERQKIRTVAGEVWQGLVEQERKGGLDALSELTDKRWPELEKIIDYYNKQLGEVDMPDYTQMLKLFTSKLHLAEASTRTHLPALVEFIERWNRLITRTLPREVLEQTGAREESLMPLYLDLEQNFESLQVALKE